MFVADNKPYVFQLVAYVIISLGLVGPVEELAFRGFVQQGFENSFGKMKGLLIASALFGLPHLASYPYNAATASVCGLVLGYVWQKTDQNTTATAVIHRIFNSIGVILVYLGIARANVRALEKFTFDFDINWVRVNFCPRKNTKQS